MTAIATATDAAPRARPAIRVPWPALLGPLPADDAEALDGLALTRRLPEGRVVFTRGTPATSLVALVDGQAACGWIQGPRGLSAERVMHGPAWLALASAWTHGQHGCDAVAQSSLVLVEVPIDALRDQVLRRPALALRLIDALAAEIERLDGRLHELMHKDAGSRLAAWLCAQTDGRHQDVLRLAERKRDIASQLGMTPETLSRMMRSLSDRGLIAVSGYTVRLLDPHGLQALAGA